MCVLVVIEDVARYRVCYTTEVLRMKIIRKNIVESGRSQMAIRLMHIACWITEATNTNSEYVILIDFPLQQRLHKCA
jgi:hypothetical protein